MLNEGSDKIVYLLRNRPITIVFPHKGTGRESCIPEMGRDQLLERRRVDTCCNEFNKNNG
jgi:hypothetical protein